MNREIKFRAWAENKMHHFDLSDTIAPSLEDNVMQFTGLKDKNGIDIYEGDVVDFAHCHEAIIYFENGAFVYIGINGLTVTLNETNLDYVSYVGNVYENPELKKLDFNNKTR